MKQETVSALLAECMKQIFAYALSRVEHKEDAEDLAGDIIEAVLRGAESIRDDHASTAICGRRHPTFTKSI